MIIEGIVTTYDRDGELNVAPMGPIVTADWQILTLRPYRTSRTYHNLKEHPQGVFHVVDDVLLLARAAIGLDEPQPGTMPAERIRGAVLQQACRWYEFEIVRIDDSSERTLVEARVVHAGWLRDFLGFNRAKHAVLEAAILATRVHLLPAVEIEQEFARLQIPVQKTAGPVEQTAFDLLQKYVADRIAVP